MSTSLETEHASVPSLAANKPSAVFTRKPKRSACSKSNFISIQLIQLLITTLKISYTGNDFELKRTTLLGCSYTLIHKYCPQNTFNSIGAVNLIQGHGFLPPILCPIIHSGGDNKSTQLVLHNLKVALF